MAEQSMIDALEGELNKKRDEVTALEQALAVLKGGNLSPRELVFVPKSQEFQHIGATEAAKRLIKEFGPMDTRRLADLMLDRGLKTRSKNFIATVYATLEQNKKDFKRIDGDWTLVED